MKTINKAPGKMRNFLRSENGVTSIEYALVAWIIAIGLVVTLVFFGEQIGNLWSSLGGCVASLGKDCKI